MNILMKNLLFLFFLFSFEVFADQMVLQPGPDNGKDTYYGTAYHPNGNPDHYYIRYGGWGDSYYGFIEFDLTEAPTFATINSAILYLYSTQTRPNDPKIEIHRIIEPWEEDAVPVFSNPESVRYKSMGRIVEGWNTVDITDLYQSWQDGIYPNYGVKLSPNYTWESNGNFFSSDETTNPELRPKLIINYTPSDSKEFVVSVTKFGETGTGSVRSDGGGINCGTQCSASLAAGTRLTLIAEPAVGSVFSGWAGGCSGTNPRCELTVTENLGVIAFFHTASPWQNPVSRLYLEEELHGLEKLGTATHAMLITHGWKDNAAAWVQSMAGWVCAQGEDVIGQSLLTVPADAITAICATTFNGTRWHVWIVDWQDQACPGEKCMIDAKEAQENAETTGKFAAMMLARLNYEHWHLIAHSAGSNLIEAFGRELKRNAEEAGDYSTTAHMTFLDGYDPKGEKSTYGKSADWADSYVDTRIITLAGIQDTTDTFFDFVNSIDVTPSSDGCGDLDDGVWSCRHDRPVRFYGKTIDPDFISHPSHESVDPIPDTLLAGIGWDLSVEQGYTLEELSKNYQIGRTSTPVVEQKVVRGVVSGDTSGAAFCQAQTWECSIITLGQRYAPAPRQIEPAATKNATSNALEPSWLVVEITATEPINTLTFNTEFLAGTDGLVSVFLNEDRVGSIDQRFAPESGIETHELYLGDLPAGHYKLAFRLDQYGADASEVQLTEIELGWMELVAGPMMTLTKDGDGSGMVLSDPPGITCGVDCVQGFPLDEVVTLTAQPDAGNRFAGWSGACSGTQPSCRLTVSAVTQIGARFESETTDPGDNRPLDWQVTEIYIATLGYAPDAEGLAYWLNNIQTLEQWTPTTVAQSFFDQPLVQARYPESLGDGTLIEALYQNLFNRAADTEGKSYWLDELQSGRMARNQMIIAMINGGWANTEAATDMARFGNRVEVALAFAAEQARFGILYSRLSVDDQNYLRRVGADILLNVTQAEGTRDAAIANIPNLLSPFHN